MYATVVASILLWALPAAEAAKDYVISSAIRTANVAAQKGVDFGILEKPSMSLGCGRSTGLARISQDFSKKILHQTGFLPASGAGGNLVQTTLLSKTTALHTDCVGEDMELAVKGTPVAFVTVNTNNDAYFSHGDERIPIMEGQLVQFDGSIAHSTVIKSGVVMLLGPFEVPSFKVIGPTSAPSTPAPTNAPCLDRDVANCCLEDDDKDCMLCPVATCCSDDEIPKPDDECVPCPDVGDGVSGKSNKGKGKGKKGGSSNDVCNAVCVDVAKGSNIPACAGCGGQG